MPHLEQPGLLYVAATLLPLLSFVLLFLGGRRWGKLGAYVATTAIGGACVLTVFGFILFLSHHEHGHAVEHGHSHANHAKADEHEHGEEHATPTPPWTDSMYWALLSFKDAEEPAMGFKLGYYIDSLSAVMFVMVSLIATLIHIYSIGYMSEELQETVDDHQAHVSRRGRFSRFFMFLSLFSFSMLNLILADNLFQIFISWELVGICSYLLIGFYYERRSAQDAANKAFITNRIGDAGFIIGLLIIWTHLGTLSFYDTKAERTNNKGEKVEYVAEHGIFSRIRCDEEAAHNEGRMPQAGEIVRAEKVTRGEDEWYLASEDGPEVLLWEGHAHKPDSEEGRSYYEGSLHGATAATIPYWLLTLAGVGVFLGCVGKSAQFPLQVWLPDAMEGPTPVSALIHAATMVAAGVYLVGRAFPLFTPDVLLIIAYTGAITLFVAATIAIVQTDIKKVLAYSTVSQLGFMMLALGVGGWVAGLFHLITHAFFKALLFLGSGSVIYGCHHEQEMTKMGGLYPKMKVTALTMLVGVLAIAGTPLFSGWYSKDAILVSALSFVSIHSEHFLLFLLPLLTAGITAFYMFRLWFMTFTGKPRDHHVYEHAHESPGVMTIPLVILAVFSLFVAWPVVATKWFEGDHPLNVQSSSLEHLMHSGQPASVEVDAFLRESAFQTNPENNYFKEYPGLIGPHDLAGMLALLSAGIGVALAFVVYYFGLLDPAQTKAQFARVHSFLWNKWHFDELYGAALVRPSLAVAKACRWFDTRVIDGVVDNSARATVLTSWWNGRFDLGIIDGLVNLTAYVIYGVGSWLRVFQTGLIRNYVLFLALAVVGIFAVLSYVMALAG